MGTSSSVPNTRFGFIDGSEREIDQASIEVAISTIYAAFPEVRLLSSFDRASILEKAAAAISAEAGTLAKEMSEETGYLSVSDMELECQRAIEALTLTAAHVRVGLSESLNLDAVERAKGATGFVRREPLGPVLGITAFNGPLLIAIHKVAGAIGAGAPIILKPSPRAPRTLARLAKLFIAAGWPKEAIATLDLDNEDTLKLIVDPRLPVISFTGGDFGWRIRELVPRKRVHLELGGIGAVFIAADANLEVAAHECAAAGFVRSGQSCISVQRIYAERGVVDDFSTKLAAAIKKIFESSPISALVNEASAKRVEAMIADAVNKGAKLECGGVRSGAYIPPTVLKNASASMSLMREEAFGPVVGIEAVDSFDEAIEKMNDVPGAIHHGIYTNRMDLAFDAANKLRAGGVIINGPCTWRVDQMPYGGTGSSGMGREGAKYAIEEFTEPKCVVFRPSL